MSEQDRAREAASHLSAHLISRSPGTTWERAIAAALTAFARTEVRLALEEAVAITEAFADEIREVSGDKPSYAQVVSQATAMAAADKLRALAASPKGMMMSRHAEYRDALEAVRGSLVAYDVVSVPELRADLIGAVRKRLPTLERAVAEVEALRSPDSPMAKELRDEELRNQHLQAKVEALRAASKELRDTAHEVVTSLKCHGYVNASPLDSAVTKYDAALSTPTEKTT